MNQQSTTSLIGDRKLTIFKTPTMNYPELWMEVFVAGDDFEQQRFAHMFCKARCTKADSPEVADLVVFTGGVDVNPVYYGAEPHPMTDKPDHKRDEEDIKLYEFCLKNGIPMFGVCRGAQFLSVMNGGKLYQHVNNHNGTHDMYIPGRSPGLMKVSSVHHQSIIENRAGGMKVLGDATKATEHWLDANNQTKGTVYDVEAYFYRDTCCFGVQGHPEYTGYDDFTKWCLDMIDELVTRSPDTEVRGRYRRLKQDLIDQRELKWTEKNKELN